VNAVNAREFCTRLEADLAAGRNEQECRGMVKAILRGLSLKECIKDAVLYLPGAKRQVHPLHPLVTPTKGVSCAIFVRCVVCGKVLGIDKLYPSPRGVV